VTAVYDFLDAQAEPKKSPVGVTCLDTLLKNQESDLMMRSGSLKDVVCEVARKIPEFGNRLFLGVVKPREGFVRGTGVAYAYLGTKHQCTECGEVMLVPAEQGVRGLLLGAWNI
jgi:hypothetical protein